MRNKEELTPSMEDYLETILLLEQKNRVARVKDIAEKLSVQMPSVTGALKSLKSRELVEYEKNSFINLTPKGLKLAKAILQRHEILVDFFSLALGLEGENAEDQACRVEHAIDQSTAERFRNLTQWVQKKNSGAKAPGTITEAE
jgi:DtxR family Mn-dependent transcriptional regulator